MNDRQKLRLMKIGGVILTLIIILILSSIFINEIASGTFSPLLYITLMPAVAIIALMIGLIVKRSKEVKSGLPIQDEMSKRIRERAGYIAYSISIYFILVLMWINFLIEDMESITLEPRFIIYGMLFFMLGVFGISLLITKRRGVR